MPAAPTRLLELVHRQGVQELVSYVEGGAALRCNLLQAAVPAHRHATPAAHAADPAAAAAAAAICVGAGIVATAAARSPAAAVFSTAAAAAAAAVTAAAAVAAAAASRVCFQRRAALAAQRAPLHAAQVGRHLHHAHPQRLQGGKHRVLVLVESIRDGVARPLPWCESRQERAASSPVEWTPPHIPLSRESWHCSTTGTTHPPAKTAGRRRYRAAGPPSACPAQDQAPPGGGWRGSPAAARLPHTRYPPSAPGGVDR